MRKFPIVPCQLILSFRGLIYLSLTPVCFSLKNTFESKLKYYGKELASENHAARTSRTKDCVGFKELLLSSISRSEAGEFPYGFHTLMVSDI